MRVGGCVPAEAIPQVGETLIFDKKNKIRIFIKLFLGS